MKTYTQEQLNEILESHIKWLKGLGGGERADLSGAYLCGADLNGADLCGADLNGADLCGADLCGADLCGADLRHASLRGANLCDADLCGANLRHADLYHADLNGADLCGADLNDANLRDADLCGANLRHADLNGADLRNANLHCADLSGANTANVCGQNIYSVDNIGSRNSKTIYHVDTDTIFCGCFKGTLDQFEGRVKEIYEDGKYRKQYDAAIRLFRELLGIVNGGEN